MAKAPLANQQQREMNPKTEDIRELWRAILSNDSDSRNRPTDKLLIWLFKQSKTGWVVKQNFSQTNFDDSKEFYDNSLQETFVWWAILSKDSDSRKVARNNLLIWLFKQSKTGWVVKQNFSQINFDDSKEFYDNSLQETFIKFDLIIQRFCQKNQITIDRLDTISEEKLRHGFISYFNRAHYNIACDLYRKWKRKSHIDGNIIISLDQPKNDDDGQEYSTVGETIEDHKNLNNLGDLNLGDLSQEAIDKLPIIGDSLEAIDRLRQCAKNVDCFEILRLKCQGYKDKQIGDKIGVDQSTVNRNWKNKCLKCIEQIIAENNKS